LWSADERPEQLLDLWADVDLALDEVQRQEGSVSGEAASYLGWRQTVCDAILVLSGCERIALWGLDL